MKPRIRVPANFGKEHINSPVHGNIKLKLKDGQEIKVNSIIMSLNSPVIDNLTSNLTQSTLEMDDFTNSAVDCFVESLYTGDVEKLEKLNFEDVNKMAHVFKVGWLSKKCLMFYKTDILKFENNSYREIEFACEIASRAHFHLKQTQFVSLFVKHVTFDEVVSKNTFLQRYLAGFAKVPRRRIDTSLAVASKDLNIIGNCLTAYLSLNFECAKFDENVLYLLQKLDVGKFRQTYPSQLEGLINFLSEILEESESACDEVKSTVTSFIKRSRTIREREKEIHDAESGDSEMQSVDIESWGDNDDFGCKDVEFQTANVKSVWKQPHTSQLEVIQPSPPIQPVQFFTYGQSQTDFEGRIALYFGFPADYKKPNNERLDRRFLMQCDNNDTSVWSYYIYGCTKKEFNSQFLCNVPREKVKHWTVTKTFTHLNVTCNNVTVLNFNFATDYSAGYENSCQIWVGNCSSVLFWASYLENLLLLSQVKECDQ